MMVGLKCIFDRIVMPYTIIVTQKLTGHVYLQEMPRCSSESEHKQPIYDQTSSGSRRK
jgi:hypothetical protein